MKRKRIPLVLDVIECSEAGEINAVTSEPLIDRQFSSRLPLLNGLLLRNVMGILSYNGRAFPTMLPRIDRGRARDQDALWHRLNGKAPGLSDGPAELESVVAWLRGSGSEHEVGPMLQELVGRTFDSAYSADAESWDAAVTLDTAIRMKNPVKRLHWKITGRVRTARKVLAAKVAGDRAAIHGTGVAIHNIVVALHAMHSMYKDLGLRRTLSPEEAVRRCLAAPAAVLRQATAAGSVSGCPFKRGALFVLKLGDAYVRSKDEQVVFQRGSWNQCPAEQWVPALLQGIWVRACRADASSSEVV